MSKTDQFDMGLELSQEALSRVVRSQHAVGVLKHTFSEWFNGNRVDLVINTPTLVLQVSGANFIARLNTRVFYNRRDPAVQGDLGTSVVADVAVRAVVTLSTGNPTRINTIAQLFIDWTGTTAADIVVNTANAALRTEVEAALIRFLTMNGLNTFVLPPIGPSDERIGVIGFRFNIVGGTPILVIGMNVGNALRGNPAGINERFIQRDWALALSKNYFLGKFRSQLSAQMPLPQRLGSKCTVKVFGQCVNKTIVTLTSLNADLRDGFILVTGHLDIHNTGALVPDADANFSAHATISVSSSGNLSVNVSSVSVDASLFGDIINFFSGDAFSDAIAEAVRQALESGTAGTPTQFFKASTINSLATGHTARPVNLSPRLTSVQIKSDAVILHGDLQTPQAEKEPEAEFVSTELPRPNPTTRRFFFYAQKSWAPGSTIAKYDWRYSDGRTETFADTNCRFVTVHDFSTNFVNSIQDMFLGRTRGGTACLKITDVQGRTDEVCIKAFEGRQTVVTVCLVYDWIPDRFKMFRPRPPRPPIPEEIFQGVFVRPPVESIETLPLVNIDDPQRIFNRQIELKSNDPRNYGLGFEPVPTEYSNWMNAQILSGDFGPTLPDIDLIFPDFTEEYFVPVCIVTGRAPAGRMTMNLELPNGQLLETTSDDNGHTFFMVKKDLLKIDKTDTKAVGIGRARLTARLNDKDAKATRVLWVSILTERRQLVQKLTKQLIEINEKFIKAVGGNDFLQSGKYKDVNEAARLSIIHIANLLDRLLNITKLLRVGSAITFIQMLLGIPKTSTPIEIMDSIQTSFDVLEKEINGLTKKIEVVEKK